MPQKHTAGILFVICFLITGIAQAILPPEIYAKASRESRIKAIATISDVQLGYVGERSTSKRATFRLEYALADDTPTTFSGTCESVDTAQQKANVRAGGGTYFYPHVGNRVFVTVRENGGRITSMTPMTKELEQVIRHEPERIEYGITSVYILRKDGKVAPPIGQRAGPPVKVMEPEIRGKEALPEDQLFPVDILVELGGELPNPPTPSQDDLQGQLLLALGEDDVGEVLRLIGLGASVNTAISATGQTPVMAAASATMAQALIDRGADPSATDTEGGTALHYAVTRRKAPELIKLLISHGVDPNLRGWENASAIFVAAGFFHETRAFAHEPIVTHEKPLNNLKNKSSRPSPKEVLKTLIDVGANINATDSYGNTLLMNATVQDNADMVKLLLELGAEKSIKRKGNGQSAKEMAYEMGHRYIFQLLD